MEKSKCTVKIFLVALFVVIVSPAKAQESEIYFNKIWKIIDQSVFAKKSLLQLDSLQAVHKPSRSYIDSTFNRVLIGDFSHIRVELQINFEEYDIDLITKNDTIVYAHAKYAHSRKLKASKENLFELNMLVSTWNNFFNSSKSVKDLKKEITERLTFAFYCGDAMPITKMGAKVNHWIRKNKKRKVRRLMQNFLAEKQAFGATAYLKLQEKGISLSANDSEIFDFIKERNSVLETCSGCISGLIEPQFLNKTEIQ